MSAYALPVGDAFQLRDDLLGVFGDSTVIGKSCVDDLRAGKHTALAALGLARASRSQAAQLRSLLGKADLAEEEAMIVREILTDTGARTEVETMITNFRTRARLALAEAAFPSAATAALHAICEIVTTYAT